MFKNKKLSIVGSVSCHQMTEENAGDPQQGLII
jgi:hypothetical protein